jgi:hypothetical protein
MSGYQPTDEKRTIKRTWGKTVETLCLCDCGRKVWVQSHQIERRKGLGCIECTREVQRQRVRERMKPFWEKQSASV